MADRKFYKIRADGDDIASVRGYLNDAEVEELTHRCNDAGVELSIEQSDPAVGLEKVLEETDEVTTWSIGDVLKRRLEKDDEETFGRFME